MSHPAQRYGKFGVDLSFIVENERVRQRTDLQFDWSIASFARGSRSAIMHSLYCFHLVDGLMSGSSETKKCLECEGVMNPIRVIDHSYGTSEFELAYSASDRTKNNWGGSYFKELGSVKAWMCDDCGAIRLYGQPKKKQ